MRFVGYTLATLLICLCSKVVATAPPPYRKGLCTEQTDPGTCSKVSHDSGGTYPCGWDGSNCIDCSQLSGTQCAPGSSHIKDGDRDFCRPRSGSCKGEFSQLNLPTGDYCLVHDQTATSGANPDDTTMVKCTDGWYPDERRSASPHRRSYPSCQAATFTHNGQSSTICAQANSISANSHIVAVPTGTTCSCTDGAPVPGTECTSAFPQKCQSCDAGYKLNGETCNACPEGTYQQDADFDGDSCSTCSGGTFADHIGSSACTSYTPCTTGKRQTSAGTTTSDQVCTQNVCKCIGGTIATGPQCTEHDANMCTSCQAGYKLVGNQCIQCPTGYSSLSGSTTCNLCIAGYGMNSTAHCNQCASPKYNNVVSNGACATKNCPKGQGFTWHNSTHASCHTCPTGQFSDSDTTGQCQAHTTCTGLKYEKSAGNATHDRVCAPVVLDLGGNCTLYNSAGSHIKWDAPYPIADNFRGDGKFDNDRIVKLIEQRSGTLGVTTVTLYKHAVCTYTGSSSVNIPHCSGDVSSPPSMAHEKTSGDYLMKYEWDTGLSYEGSQEFPEYTIDKYSIQHRWSYTEPNGNKHSLVACREIQNHDNTSPHFMVGTSETNKVANNTISTVVTGHVSPSNAVVFPIYCYDGQGHGGLYTAGSVIGDGEIPNRMTISLDSKPGYILKYSVDRGGKYAWFNASTNLLVPTSVDTSTWGTIHKKAGHIYSQDYQPSAGFDYYNQHPTNASLSYSYYPDDLASVKMKFTCSDGAGNAALPFVHTLVINCKSGYQRDPSNNRCTKVCNKGHFVNGDQCEACGVGTVQDKDGYAGYSCSTCPSETFASSAGSSACTGYTPCPTGQLEKTPGTTTSDRVCGCPSTKVYNPSSQRCDCRPGYRAEGPFGNETCHICPTGSSSVRGAAKCDLCIAGYGKNSTGQCSQCKAPQYNNKISKDDACADKSCPVGQGSVWHNSTHVSCQPCPNGEFSDDTSGQCQVHTPCDGSNEKVKTNGTTTSDQVCECKDGYRRDEVTGNCKKIVCGKGKYLRPFDHECIDCGTGTFQEHDNFDGDSCTSHTTCSAWQHQTTAGTAISDRVCAQNVCKCTGGTIATGTACTANDTNICTSCQAGYKLVGNQCIQCPASTWSTANSTSCTPHTNCVAGQRVKIAGTAISNTVCLQCPTGYSSSQNSATCNKCTAGYGMKADNITCEVCASPKYNNVVSNAPCATKHCPKGQGFTWHNSTHASCSACPTGHFSDSDTTGQCEIHTICPAGQHEKTTGNATSDRTCVQCPASSWSKRGSTSCTPHTNCEQWQHETNAGTFTSDTVCARNVCTCTGGTAANDTDCTTHNKNICKSCSATGRVYNSTSRMCDCAAGFRVSGNQCIQCPTGSWSFQNSATCDLCISGYGMDATTTGTCTQCVSPKFKNEVSNGACIVKNCPRGQGFTWHNSTHTSCHECPDGQFSDSDTTGQCKLHETCKPGEYVSRNGNTTHDRQCTSCTNGKTSDKENSPSCDLCIAGYGRKVGGGCEQCAKPQHNNVTSNAPCATKNCPKGQGFTWHNSIHTSCQTCSSGQFSDSNTTGQCQPHTICPAGQYEKTDGTVTSDRVCAACPSGTFSDAAGSKQCTPHTTCNVHQYEFKAPTPSSDRVCRKNPKTFVAKVKFTGFSSDPCGNTTIIKNSIAPTLPHGTCGQAQCQAKDLTDRLCKFSTQSRRLLSTSGNVDYAYSVQSETTNDNELISAMTNSAAITAAVNTQPGYSGVQVEQGSMTSHVTTTHGSSGVFMCNITNGFMPAAHGASVGTCANRSTFLGGQSCSPVCASGAILTQNASCDTLGEFHQAVCTEKQCTCQNGVKAVGIDCNSHGDADCVSCNTGFHLDNNAGGSGVHLCKANECSCVNGKNVTGTACIVHQSNHCASCAQGYHLNNVTKACVSCPAGTMQGVPTNANGISSCQNCPKGTVQPSTASPSCVACANDHYVDQTGQTTCTLQPTLAELNCAHAAGKFPTKLPSKGTRRACVSNPSCDDLKYHYTESGMQCQTKCFVSLHTKTSPCHITKQKFMQNPACYGSCRRRRTAT